MRISDWSSDVCSSDLACGPGNNGGDGYVLARHAREAGRQVRVLRLPGHAPRSEIAMRAERADRDAGGGVEEFADSIGDVDMVVDALFVIGLARAPAAEAAAPEAATPDASSQVTASRYDERRVRQESVGRGKYRWSAYKV